MRDFTPAAPSPSFHTYRRQQFQAAIVRELRKTDPATSTLGPRRVDATGINAAMHQLTASPDPAVVFTQLATLLVPTVCDHATASVLTGNRLAHWQEHPTRAADIPTRTTEPDGRTGWTVTIHTPAHSSRHNPVAPEPEWVAVLTCRGTGDLLTAAEVALIKLAGRCAAGAVHQAQQAQQLHRRQHLIDNLSAALHTDGEIGVAVGVLMEQHQLTYRQAFDLLVETASTHHQRAGLTDGNLTVVFTETSGG